MAHWIRFERQGQAGFGTLDGETIRVHDGDMFEAPRPTAQTVPLADVKVLTPCVPSKMILLIAASISAFSASSPLRRPMT